LEPTKKDHRVITFEDGTEHLVNLNLVKMDEYRAIFREDEDGKTPPDSYAEGLMARAIGMPGVDIAEELGYIDYKKVQDKFFEIARNPLADPNSVSESTSD